jgi:hypothetical protein
VTLTNSSSLFGYLFSISFIFSDSTANRALSVSADSSAF